MSRWIAARPRYFTGPVQTIGTTSAIEPPSIACLKYSS
jgi:hypothetical protein